MLRTGGESRAHQKHSRQPPQPQPAHVAHLGVELLEVHGEVELGPLREVLLEERLRAAGRRQLRLGRVAVHGAADVLAVDQVLEGGELEALLADLGLAGKNVQRLDAAVRHAALRHRGAVLWQVR